MLNNLPYIGLLHTNTNVFNWLFLASFLLAFWLLRFRFLQLVQLTKTRWQQMHSIQTKKARAYLKVGTLYTGVSSNVQQVFVFVSEESNYHDDLYVCTFWDPEHGGYTRISCRETALAIASALQNVKEVGTQMLPIKKRVPIFAATIHPAVDCLEHIRLYVPYFLDLLAGKPDIENWHIWLRNNAKSLVENLTKSRYVRLKVYPISTIIQLLELLQIQYTLAPRYLWLDPTFEYKQKI